MSILLNMPITIQENQIRSAQDAVLFHLKSNPITSYEAFNLYDTTRLAVIIHNLRRKGYNITSIPMEKKTKWGEVKIYSKYQYIAPPAELTL